MSVTYPTRAAVSIQDAEVADLQVSLDELEQLPDLAMPTLQIMMMFAGRGTQIGPKGKIFQDKFVRAGDAEYGTEIMDLPTDTNNLTTEMEWDGKFLVTGNSISDRENIAYSREGTSKMDVAIQRVAASHEGVTRAFNISMWAGFTTAAGANGGVPGVEVVGNQIRLDDFDPAFPGNVIRGANVRAQRWNSIPMSIRNYSATQTQSYIYGGITINSATDNQLFQSHVVEGTGSTITYNTTDTTVGGIPTNVASPEVFSKPLLARLLRAIQVGSGYGLMVAMPSDIYDSAVDILFPQQQGTVAAPLTDLSIDSMVTWKAYNAHLYADPILDNMWPNSIWAYDPMALRLVLDEAFMPYVYPWQRVGHTTTMGWAEVFYGNLINVNPRATGVIHGVTAA